MTGRQISPGLLRDWAWTSEVSKTERKDAVTVPLREREKVVSYSFIIRELKEFNTRFF